MRYRRMIPVAGAALLVLVVTFFFRSADHYEAAVQQIIETPQTYSGEHVERLIALGSDGVPAIGDALSRDQPFPLAFVLALEGIGNERGAAPVLDFVKSLAPFSDVDRSTLTALSIEALGKMEDVGTVDTLLNIATDGANHPRVRLASAASVCRLVGCGEGERSSAEAVILNYDRDRAKYFVDANKGFSEVELFEALIAADTNESMEIVLATAQKGLSTYVVRSTISYLKDKPGESAANALLFVVTDKDRYELPVRLSAAAALARRAASRPTLTKEIAKELMEEAVTDDWPEEIVEQARKLGEATQK